jgi:hypothetical protein
MLKKLALIAILAPFAALPALAQQTRAEVKSEAASANKSGAIATGEATKAPKSKSTAPRAEVKGESKAANKAGGTVSETESAKTTKTKSEKARPEVKKETAEANKAGKIERGDASK